MVKFNELPIGTVFRQFKGFGVIYKKISKDSKCRVKDESYKLLQIDIEELCYVISMPKCGHQFQFYFKPESDERL